MTATTIKVSTETRDRLKQQAGAAGAYLGQHLEHLDHLADLGDREERFDRLRSAVARTSAEDAATLAAETSAWETAELTDAG